MQNAVDCRKLLRMERKFSQCAVAPRQEGRDASAGVGPREEGVCLREEEDLGAFVCRKAQARKTEGDGKVALITTGVPSPFSCYSIMIPFQPHIYISCNTSKLQKICGQCDFVTLQIIPMTDGGKWGNETCI